MGAEDQDCSSYDQQSSYKNSFVQPFPFPKKQERKQDGDQWIGTGQGTNDDGHANLQANKQESDRNGVTDAYAKEVTDTTTRILKKVPEFSVAKHHDGKETQTGSELAEYWILIIANRQLSIERPSRFSASADG